MKKICTYNILLGQKHMQFRQPNVMDHFVSEQIHVEGSNLSGIAITNPLQMMLNQKRIENLGNMSVKDWLEAFSLQKSNDIQKLRSQCTDEELCSLVKSRHLQSPAELLAWSKKMSQDMKSFSDQVKEHLEQMKQTETQGSNPQTSE